MLDIKFIKDNPERVKENIKKRFQEQKIPLVDKVIKNYDSWLELKKEAEELRHKRNVISEKINLLKKHNKDASAELKQVKEIPEKFLLNSFSNFVKSISPFKVIVVPPESETSL